MPSFTTSINYLSNKQSKSGTLINIFFSSYMITSFSSWTFFVLLNAYYGGALTMFFVSEPTLPFNTLRDVLKAFPSWNFVFIDGLDNYFKMPADQVDTIVLYRIIE